MVKVRLSAQNVTFRAMKATHLVDRAIPESQLILNPDGSVYHLGVTGDKIADTVLVVGDPERVPTISAKLDRITYRRVGREFVVHTGVLGQREVTILSTGIGVDNIDIVLNELDAAVNIDPVTRTPRAQLRSLDIIRIGTCGSLREDISVGTPIASAYAIGYDGVPWHYASEHEADEAEIAEAFKAHTQWPDELSSPYCAKANDELLIRFADDKVKGITMTANGFYGPQNRSLRLPLADDSRMERIRAFSAKGLNATNFEMECAGIYALSSLLGHRALTCCVVLANRYREEFSSDPAKEVNNLIDNILDRL